MSTHSAHNFNRYFRAVALPVFAMLAMTAVLGFFALVVNPRLQAVLPLASWPLGSKAMHYFAPWFAVSNAFCAGGLCLNSLGISGFNYFTGRRTVIALLAIALMTVLLVVWASMAVIIASVR